MKLYILFSCLLGVLLVAEISAGKLKGHRFDLQKLQREVNAALKEGSVLTGTELRTGPLLVQNKTCTQNGYDLKCCMHIAVEKLDDTMCFIASYLPKDYGISLVITWDGKVYVNATVSARNPPPICAAVPYLESFAKLCLRFKDLRFNNHSLHGCLDFVAKVTHVVVEDVPIGCFSLPPFSPGMKTELVAQKGAGIASLGLMNKSPEQFLQSEKFLENVQNNKPLSKDIVANEIRSLGLLSKTPQQLTEAERMIATNEIVPKNLKQDVVKSLGLLKKDPKQMLEAENLLKKNELLSLGAKQNIIGSLGLVGKSPQQLMQTNRLMTENEIASKQETHDNPKGDTGTLEQTAKNIVSSLGLLSKSPEQMKQDVGRMDPYASLKLNPMHGMDVKMVKRSLGKRNMAKLSKALTKKEKVELINSLGLLGKMGTEDGRLANVVNML